MITALQDRFGLALAATLIAAIMGWSPSLAEPSTSRGQISVAQIRAMLDHAGANPAARQALTAYLAGAGETAGWLIDAAAERGVALQSCPRGLSLDAASARQALESIPQDAKLAAETPATPLIVRDMLRRAGCRFNTR